ncbi:MFS transporter [Actinokineospora auranticolor]|uniref:MFS transporter n=2 Tax=Actinokineospora auranticolor TaxID=155976 RepID=A0A2S6H1U4_9PSEU|nr:MFS transporter [Actinokineospora auranticolor]
MTIVAINTAIGQTYPDRLRPRVLALMAASWVGPSLLGPPLAGLVVSWTSWRVVFFGLAALTLPPAVAVVLLLRKTRHAPPPPSEGRRPGLLVAAAVSAGAAAGQYAVTGGDVAHLVFGAVAVVLVVAFVRRMLPPRTLTAARGLPATVLLNGLASGTFCTLEAFVPLLLDTAEDVPPALTGLVFTGAAVAWAGSSWAQSHFLVDVPRHRTVAMGATLVVAAAALAAAGPFFGLPAYFPAASLVLAAIGMGMVSPMLTVLSLAHAEPGRQGSASSAMMTSRNLGQLGVTAASSALFSLLAPATRLSFGAAFAILAVPSLLLALLASRTRDPVARSAS